MKLLSKGWNTKDTEMLTDIFVAGKIIDFSNADVAVDEYHRYEVSNSTSYVVPYTQFSANVSLKWSKRITGSLIAQVGLYMFSF